MLNKGSRATADGAGKGFATSHSNKGKREGIPKHGTASGANRGQSATSDLQEPAYSGHEQTQTQYIERALQLLCLIAQSLRRIEERLDNITPPEKIVVFNSGGRS